MATVTPWFVSFYHLVTVVTFLKDYIFNSWIVKFKIFKNPNRRSTKISSTKYILFTVFIKK